MSYVGNTPTTQAFTPAIDYFSGNASTTAFTLSRPVASVAQVQAVIENVPQNPGDAFTVSNNTITFTSAPPSGTNNIYVYYTSPITQVIAPSQGTVGTTQIQNGAVGVSQLSATGTPSSSTYLRGDNTWGAVTSAFQGVGGQVFTSSGTFTVPSGVTAVKVTIVGGGGGGGGTNSSPSPSAGGGGGAGGAGIAFVTGLTPGDSITATVGAAGTAGAAGGSGGAGGTSSFGAYCTATGGGAGLVGGTGYSVGAGGAGGSTTGTVASLVSSAGNSGSVTGTSCCLPTTMQGGTGGASNGSLVFSSIGGSGGSAGNGSKNAGSAANSSGKGAGGGGGARASNAVAGNVGGGAGSAGYILVEW